MFILDYIKRVGNSFKRRDVETEIDVIRDELQNHTLPPLKQLLKEFPGSPRFTSRSYGLYNGEFSRSLKVNVRGDMFVAMDLACAKAELLITFAYNYVHTQFEEETTRAGLTLACANIMRLIDAINFFNRYARRLTDMILIAETNHKISASDQELKDIRPIDIEYLANGRESFIRVTEMLISSDVRTTERMFDNIPEVILSDVKTKTALEIHGNDKVDPMNLGKNFIASGWNPIWLTGVGLAEYQHNRYKSAKEDSGVILLRIQRLRAQYDNNPNPKLAGIIKNYEGQVDSLRAQVSRYERKVQNG